MKSFLIVRYIDSDKFSVLGIDSSWYGKAKSDVSKEHELAEIDCVTSLFPNKRELVKRLLHSGYIENGDVDLFVVAKDKNGKLKVDDVLYGGDNPCFTTRVAYSELHGKKDYDGCQALFSKCATLLGSMDEFRDILFKGSTRLNPEIVDSFSKSFTSDGSFDFKDFIKHISYRSIRNVMIAFSKSNLYNSLGYEIAEGKYDYDDRNLERRESVLSEFRLKYYGDFCPGQMSFFETNEVESIPLTEEKKHKQNFYKYGVLLDYLESLKTSLFTVDRNNVKFNEAVFKYPISKEDRSILQDLPSKSIVKNMLKLNDAVCKYERCSLLTDVSSERLQLLRERSSVVRRCRNNLVSLFNSDREGFYKTENWISTLSRCMEIDSMYDSIGYSDPRYGESTKVFGKRPNEGFR